MNRDTYYVLEVLVETVEKDVANMAGIINLVKSLDKRITVLEKANKKEKLVPYEGLVPHG